MLGALLEETRGVVGVVLGTTEGELRAVVGSVPDGDGGAAVAAAITGELHQIGALLGMGELGAASLKATSASRVFARQADAVLMIELDPKRPLGELENKLRTRAWAPEGPRFDGRSDAWSAEAGSLGGAGSKAAGSERERIETSSPGERSEPRTSAAMLPPSRPTPLPLPLPPAPTPAPPMRANRMTPPSTMPAVSPPAATIPPARATPPPARLLERPQSVTTPAVPRPAGRSTPMPAMPAPVSTPMKTVGQGPVFSGDLEQFCLPDLLELLRNSHRTGLLMCTTAAGVGTVQLSRGMIISADSPHALDLRQYFLTSSELDPEQRRVLGALPPESFEDDQIEGALVMTELVPRNAVERARVARIYSAFREMMEWTVGRFSFDPAVPVATNPALALSAQSILMQIYQEQDEQGR